MMPGMADAQITVRLRARAGKNQLGELLEGKLLARVTAPPVDGRANRAVCRLIAKKAGVAPTRVTIVMGEKSPDKVIRVEGVDSETLERSLA
jgi:uncharacterized protein (TIGR00251 family)